MTDAVTGAHTEVSQTVGLPLVECWTLVTDVSRAAEASPECVEATWLDDVESGLWAGARFAGRNRFPSGLTTEVTCVVTEAEAPTRFEWVVLDGSADPRRPQSLWRYELTPVGDRRTEIRHRFTHGPGDSGARRAAHDDPGSLQRRLEQLRRNMCDTLGALINTVTSKETVR